MTYIFSSLCSTWWIQRGDGRNRECKEKVEMERMASSGGRWGDLAKRQHFAGGKWQQPRGRYRWETGIKAYKTQQGVRGSGDTFFFFFFFFLVTPLFVSFDILFGFVTCLFRSYFLYLLSINFSLLFQRLPSLVRYNHWFVSLLCYIWLTLVLLLGFLVVLYWHVIQLSFLDRKILTVKIWNEVIFWNFAMTFFCDVFTP